MLIQKFIVPVSRELYLNSCKNFPNINQIVRFKSSKPKCNEPPSVTSDATPSKCHKYQENLAKCPKKSSQNRDQCKNSPTPECKRKIVTDDYQDVCQSLNNRMQQLLKDIETESSSILARLEKNLQLEKSNDAAQLEKLFHDAKLKLVELMSLDGFCGCEKRKCAMFLGNEARRAFEGLRHDVLPSVERITWFLKSLENEALICIGRAKHLALGCRKCKNPQELAKCIEEDVKCAGNMLERAAEDVRIRLNEIKKFEEDVVKFHEKATNEVLETHREKIAAFSKCLERCILGIKKAAK